MTFFIGAKKSEVNRSDANKHYDHTDIIFNQVSSFMCRKRLEEYSNLGWTTVRLVNRSSIIFKWNTDKTVNRRYYKRYKIKKCYFLFFCVVRWFYKPQC